MQVFAGESLARPTKIGTQSASPFAESQLVALRISSEDPLAKPTKLVEVGGIVADAEHGEANPVHPLLHKDILCIVTKL